MFQAKLAEGVVTQLAFYCNVESLMNQRSCQCWMTVEFWGCSVQIILIWRIGQLKNFLIFLCWIHSELTRPLQLFGVQCCFDVEFMFFLLLFFVNWHHFNKHLNI